MAVVLATMLIGCEQPEYLQSGPMLGYADLREVMVWVQTKQDSRVKLRYWPQGDSTSAGQIEMISNMEEDAGIVKFLVGNLDPGTTYRYELYFNNVKKIFNYPTTFKTQDLWQYRTDPPEFTILLGSCTYVNEQEYDRPGKGYGGDYPIFQSMAKEDADLMLWLGDNTYYREVDWNTRSGMIYRNTHTRSIPELQGFLASCNHYAIWDDHDYGPNDATGSFIHKDRSKEIFEMFWGNPGYGNSELPGINYAFQYNDVDFFALDDRWHRTDVHKKGNNQLYGRDQIDWLIDALRRSRANFKFVMTGGQILNTAQVYENHSRFPEEREYLLRRLDEEDILGVVFLTGDRHHSELSMLQADSTQVIYDFTSSPLTSSASDVAQNETNELRITGSLKQVRNYGKIEVRGPFGKRYLNVSIMSNTGKLLWQHRIKSPYYEE